MDLFCLVAGKCNQIIFERAGHCIRAMGCLFHFVFAAFSAKDSFSEYHFSPIPFQDRGASGCHQ
jgi:hypothetical protein